MKVRLLTGHHEGLPVWDVAWSGDSMFLVSCGADRSLVVRVVPSGAIYALPLARYGSISPCVVRVAFSSHLLFDLLVDCLATSLLQICMRIKRSRANKKNQRGDTRGLGNPSPARKKRLSAREDLGISTLSSFR